MNIILYNPLSRNGKNPKFINKIAQKTCKNQTYKIQNILEIQNVEQYIKKLDANDQVILVGGDGTLNRLVNRIHGIEFSQNLFMYKAGTGNDFMRSLKTKQHLVKINDYIKSCPSVYFQDSRHFFLNGAGIGLDGYVGYLVNTSDKKKNKLNYFKQAFKAFVKFKPIEAQITIDGKTIVEKKVWLASVMHAAYFGGGMKIAPHAKRDVSQLHVVVVKNIPKWLLILIFPTIYLGWHRFFKSFVNIYKVNEVKLAFKENTHMQVDGEHYYPIKTIQCHV